MVGLYYREANVLLAGPSHTHNSSIEADLLYWLEMIGRFSFRTVALF
jgi:hypothetical protein